jgi:nucleoside-diphosphate-sugar epimerase
MPTRYAETKRRGEEAIRAWAERGLEVVTLAPSLVYGPPGKKEGANALLRQLWLGRFPVRIGGRRKTSWIFLDDVVEAIVRALGAPAGERYLLAGEVATVDEIAARLHALGGALPPRFELPVGAARWLLRAAAPLYRLRGRRPPIPIEQVASLGRHWAFDDAKARRALDWRPRPLAEGLPPTAQALFGPSAR